MKLTTESEKLMSMFIKNKCISHSKQTNKTDNVLRQLYTDMRDADELIKAEKRRLGNSFYKLKVIDFKGTGVAVPRPSTFNANIQSLGFKTLASAVIMTSPDRI